MNTQTISAVTIDSAPLALAELSQVGRFQLRRLAEALTIAGVPLVDTDAKRQAFMQSALPVMAETILAGLKIYRKDSGTSSTMPPQQAEEPAQEPAAAQEPTEAAPSPLTEEPKVVRQPRTQNSNLFANDAPAANAVTQAHRANGASTNSTHVDLAALATSLQTGFTNLTSVLGTFNAETTVQTQRVTELHARMDGLEAKLDTALGLLMLMAEESINSSLKDILEAGKERFENAPFPS